jgi:hypothetical protein
MTRFVIAFILACVCLCSCVDQNKKEERLAKQNCGSCHIYPEPALLDKKSWERVLPHMAFLMGFSDMEKLAQMSEADRNIVIPLLPAQPMISEEEFQAIRNFYLREAPNSLKVDSTKSAKPLQQFDASTFTLSRNGSPAITLIHSDSANQKIYLGTRSSWLYQLNNDFVKEDSFKLASPPSEMMSNGKEGSLLLEMGIMDPNDESRGQLISSNLAGKTQTVLIDSLKRPVHLEQVDLNNDAMSDFVICAFGNYSGALLAYEKQSDGNYKKHILQQLPGARRVIVRDFDNNGLKDILVLLTQGDEKILLLHNQGNFKFRITTLLRFPSVYGSSYFDIADFNSDGKFDILYTNGDNADYSMILKPYHGVRIFLNTGTNQFKESWFHPMHGASKAIARDFDGDGDLDIAAISFFPDFKHHPEQGFIYFEKGNEGYIPHTTSSASNARWLTMEAIDLENDGDTDLLLGALNFPTQVPPALFDQWDAQKASILILKNKQH